MQFSGAPPEDAPDPRVQQWQRIARLPFSIFGLVPQPTLEEFGPSEYGTSTDGAGIRGMSVSLGYTVIRHPENRSDPANLADLDDEIRMMLDGIPSHPRPKWLPTSHRTTQRWR